MHVVLSKFTKVLELFDHTQLLRSSIKLVKLLLVASKTPMVAPISAVASYA